MRGENKVNEKTMGLRKGTSPRARGKRPTNSDWMGTSRNIPACAGKTTRRGYRLHLLSEHPRVRGENGVWVW